jgi:hypothetical protein
MTTTAQRQADPAYKRRLRARGLVPVLVWGPTARAEELRAVAQRMRAARNARFRREIAARATRH